MEQNEQQPWYSLEINAAPEAAEAVEFALNSLEALGTEINHLKRSVTDAVKIVGYFNSLPDDEWVQDELQYALRSYSLNAESISSVERREVQNEDWLAEWKKHWKPTAVGGFVIAPPWEDFDADGRIVIRIEPNMAFGTGTHETTQLCLKAVEAHYAPGDSFLDVGTGTGILAIGAAKLNLAAGKNAKIYGCDTDTDSVKLARENAELNHVGSAVEFAEGPLADDAPEFEFTCANLTIDVILPILPLLFQKTSKTLVLSGILREQEPMIASALGDRVHAIERAGEWIAVTVAI